MPKTYAKKGQELTVPKYFYQPKNSRVWYIRIVPPKHMKHAVSEAEFRKSTGQADLKRAIPIGMTLVAEKLREWDALSRATKGITAKLTILTKGLIETICSVRLYSWMRTDDDEREAGLTDQQLAENDNFCELTDTTMRAVLAQGPASTRWAEVVESVLDWSLVMGYALDLSDPLFPQLVREFAKTEKEANRRIATRNQGDDAETPPAPVNNGKTLSSITEEFRAHKATKADAKHVGTVLNAWRLFINHCGDIAFDSIKPLHVFDFMFARMSAETKPWSEKRAKTFGKRALREVFGFARTKGLMTISNPVDDLEAFPSLSKEEETARKKPRLPFTTEQLNALFRSPWYDPNEVNLFRGKMRTDLGARYWVPLIGLFHGNRVREAVQLVASDFGLIGDLFVVTFRTELDQADEDGSAGQARRTGTAAANELQKLRSLKNKATSRTIPVHPRLVELGIADFVKKRRKESGANALLFPSSMPEGGGSAPKLGRAYEQAFLRFVRDGLAFGAGYGNHSFRHQLEDRIRIAQATTGVWPPGLGQQYSGRKRTRPADREVLLAEGSEADYGNGYPSAAILPYVKKLDFSTIDLPQPFTTWAEERSASLRALG